MVDPSALGIGKSAGRGIEGRRCRTATGGPL